MTMSPTLPHLVLGWGMPTGPELIIILVVALLIFGHKLPSVMRNLGGSIREFKKGMDDGDKKPEHPPVAPPAQAPEGVVSRDSVAKTDAGKPVPPTSQS